MAETYRDPDRLDRAISRGELASEIATRQATIMTRWFLDHFEEPRLHGSSERNTKNLSAEDYWFQVGGPRDARSELEQEFFDFVAYEAINASVEQIEASGISQWTPSERENVAYITDEEGNYYVDEKGEFYVTENMEDQITAEVKEHSVATTNRTEETFSGEFSNDFGRGNDQPATHNGKFVHDGSITYGSRDLTFESRTAPSIIELTNISSRLGELNDDLAKIRSIIAAGREPTLGGELELENRSAFQKDMTAFLAFLAAQGEPIRSRTSDKVPQERAGLPNDQEGEPRRAVIGHNQPPENMQLSADEAEIRSLRAATGINEAIENEPPNITKVIYELTVLQRIGRSLLRKFDMMTDEAAKSTGKSLGPFLTGSGALLALHIVGVTEAALVWLRAAFGL